MCRYSPPLAYGFLGSSSRNPLFSPSYSYLSIEDLGYNQPFKSLHNERGVTNPLNLSIMESYFPLYKEKMGCNWLSSRLQLQQKCGSRARCGPRSDVETRSSQARVCVGRKNYTGSHFNVETRPWVLHLKEQHDHCVWHRTRSSCRIVNEVWRPRLRLERDLRFCKVRV